MYTISQYRGMTALDEKISSTEDCAAKLAARLRLMNFCAA
jgi:hypothetical protein